MLDQNRHRPLAVQPRFSEAPTQTELSAFRSALDQLVQDRGTDEQAVADVLLDFFISRCLSAKDLRDLAITVSHALHASTAQGITLGCFAERFQFRRLDRKLSVFVDEHRLATIPVDDGLDLVRQLLGGNDVTPSYR